jgi:hypothetical protein
MSFNSNIIVLSASIFTYTQIDRMTDENNEEQSSGHPLDFPFTGELPHDWAHVDVEWTFQAVGNMCKSGVVQ